MRFRLLFSVIFVDSGDQIDIILFYHTGLQPFKFFPLIFSCFSTSYIFSEKTLSNKYFLTPFILRNKRGKRSGQCIVSIAVDQLIYLFLASIHQWPRAHTPTNRIFGGGLKAGLFQVTGLCACSKCSACACSSTSLFPTQWADFTFLSISQPGQSLLQLV